MWRYLKQVLIALISSSMRSLAGGLMKASPLTHGDST